LEKDSENINKLIEDMEKAVEILNINKESFFFMQLIKKAAKITQDEKDPEKLLIQLAENIGMSHLAWCTPVSACFWSYRADNDFNKWFKYQGLKNINVGGKIIDSNTIKKEVFDSHVDYLHKIGEYDDFIKRHGYHWRSSIDVDTFFSIAFSLIAAEKGIKPIQNEIKKVDSIFKDDLRDISFKLVYHIKDELSIKKSIKYTNMTFKSIIYEINENIDRNIGKAGIFLNKNLPGLYKVIKKLKK